MKKRKGKPTGSGTSQTPSSNGDGPLSAKQQAFVREYLVDLNATAAYKRAGYKGTGHTAEANSQRMLRNAEVKKAIDAAIAVRAKKTELQAEDVLRRWTDIADADPRELIELRRVCCRNCYGQLYRYQRTQGEMEAARKGHELLEQRAAKDATDPPPPFDEQGGEGYDRRKAPNPDCPECFGEGVELPFPRDTRLLSPAAARLFAGVKVTKDGFEIKMRDQDAALLNVAKHLGMMIKKIEHSGTGEGGAIPIKIVGVKIVPPKEPDASTM